jgi:hypothetical protein
MIVFLLVDYNLVVKSYTLASSIFFTNFGNARYLYIDSHLVKRLENLGCLVNCLLSACFGNLPKTGGLQGEKVPFYNPVRLYNSAHKKFSIY